MLAKVQHLIEVFAFILVLVLNGLCDVK